MLQITRQIKIPEKEIDIHAVRSQGTGGQNVNKVSTAIHLRFDIHSSSLPETIKQGLMTLKDRRITRDGIIIIKAQQFRSQEKNRSAALERLKTLIQKAMTRSKKRIPTKPTHASRNRRLDSKIRHGLLKKLRLKITSE